MELYIYIDGVSKRVEMFQDEKVSVTSTIQNYSDIGKLFTDYSQSFTIPASATNNAIFSHWYDNAVDNGYDARIRYNAYIEIDTIPFREGNVQLEKANKKNGYIESYSLTFYGNLTQLKDKFADDKLQSLDFSSLNHTYDASTVISKINTNGAGVLYPLIGNNRELDYKTATATDVTTNTGAINWTDLFPAVPITTILDFIETKYGITFTGSFLGYNQFIKLYMLLKNSELPRAYSQGLKVDYLTTTGTPFPELNFTTDVITTNWDSGFGGISGPQRLILKYKLTPSLATINTIYKIELFVDGQVYSSYPDLSGTQEIILYSQTRSEDPENHQMFIKVSSIGDLTFTSRLEYIRRRSGDAVSTGLNNTGQSMTFIQDVSAYVPEIKVSDFFMGLVKMFNLIVTPLNETTFKLEPLELYYQGGAIKDLTKYIYADEIDIEKPKLFKSIEFKYEQSENILNNAFNGLFNRQYGDLTYNSGSNADSGTYDIKLPFEDVMWERTPGYNFQTATLLNKDYQSYTPKPILMYNNGLSDVSAFPIKIFNGAGYTNVSNYVRFNNEVNLAATDLNYLYSLNFGNEVSSWYLVNSPQGLYRRHYEQYIANLYNQKTRVVKVKAKLEPLELTSLKLNNRIIIRDNRYIINSFTTDLTNGEASFDLINDYRALGYNSVGYRFANIEMLNVDNTAQEVQVDVYMGVFANAVVATETGWASWTGSGLQTTDFSVNVSIAANGTLLERTKNFEIKFEDFDGNIVFAQIPLTQDL